jgi:hypothetical protein
MMKSAILLAALAVHPQQDPVPTPPDADAPPSADAEALRARVHEMRMNLLLGGDHVHRAEDEAVGFYNEKLGYVDERMDGLRADLTEKRTTYDLAVERTLDAETGEQRVAAMRDAQRLRAEIATLERETGDLDQKRESLSSLIAGIEARDRDRRDLVAQLETTGDFDAAVSLPLSSIGLAPRLPDAPDVSPLEDEALIDDLMRRDPRAARRVLFESDPEGYWRRFPLRPPADVLRSAMDFPLPDLPGER